MTLQAVLKEEHPVIDLAQLQQQIDTLRRENEQLRLERDLAKAYRSRFELLFEAAPGGMIMLDGKRRVALINEEARRLLQIRHDAAPGCQLDNLLAGYAWLEPLAKAFGGEPFTPVLLRRPAEDDDPAAVIRAEAVVAKATVGSIGTLIQLTDVTAEHQEIALKNDAVGIAAHELCNPLATISGFVELLLENGSYTHEQQVRFFTFIRDKARLMAKIVGDMQHASRLEAGQPLKLQVRPCDLRELVRQVKLECGEAASRVVLELPAEPLRVLVDAERTSQVLTNLVSNALKFSPEDRPVRIRAEVAGPYARVAVSDQGCGIPSNELSRVFDKYYRSVRQRGRSRGLGLGLTIVRAIVEAHGGKVALRSRVGVGTSACFTLPRAGLFAVETKPVAALPVRTGP